MNAFAGRHVVAELYGVDAAVLNDEPMLCRVLTDSLTAAGAQVLRVLAHRFQPHGVTVVAVLAESHASLHSYPELGSAFVDVFACGERADPHHAVTLLAAALAAPRIQIHGFDRGVTPGLDRSFDHGLDRGCGFDCGFDRGGGRQIIEPITPGLFRTWQVDDVLWEGHTPYQHVLIARTMQGISLFCDHERQSAEDSQLVYHEALMVPALLLADRRERVLIIGSSEGVAPQIALAAGASTVDHVDIDAQCVQRCAHYLPYGYTSDQLHQAETGHHGLRIHYLDGWEFLNQQRTYDIVILDLPEERPEHPTAAHNRLYSTEFLRRCRDALRAGGVVAGQAGCPTLWRNAALRRSYQRFSEVFTTVVPYCSDEHEWAFLTARPDTVPDPIPRMLAQSEQLPYHPTTIDPDALRRGTVLPHSIRTTTTPD